MESIDLSWKNGLSALLMVADQSLFIFTPILLLISVRLFLENICRCELTIFFLYFRPSITQHITIIHHPVSSEQWSHRSVSNDRRSERRRRNDRTASLIGNFFHECTSSTIPRLPRWILNRTELKQQFISPEKSIASLNWASINRSAQTQCKR